MFGFGKGRYQLWAGKQAGNPSMLFIAAIGFSGSFYIGYKYLYGPWARRKSREEAEMIADIIYQQELREE